MQSVTQRRAVWVLVGVVAVTAFLAAAALTVLIFGAVWFGESLYPGADLEDVTREEAALAGYTVPGGATHVCVRDRSLQDLRITWFQFELDPQRRGALSDKYTSSEGHTAGTWPGEVPSHWPPFHTLEGFDAPDWWVPELGATTYRRESRGVGSVIVFGDSRVHHLLWTWEGWEP
jgi:hypothetical protein